jgi:hypothetical protein
MGATTTRAAVRPEGSVAMKLADMPYLKRRRMRFEAGGRLIELDLLWCSRMRWERRSESLAGGWNVWPLGPFVLAARLTV